MTESCYGSNQRPVSDVQLRRFASIILIIKPTKCTNVSNLFWNETLHVSDSSSVHHQEYFTVHTAMVYVIHIPLLCVQWKMTYTTAVCTVKNSRWWTEELSKTCRVLFQNKFEKLVHLVGFIIGIWHDAWSHERKICPYQLSMCIFKTNSMVYEVYLLTCWFTWLKIKKKIKK